MSLVSLRSGTLRSSRTLRVLLGVLLAAMLTPDAFAGSKRKPNVLYLHSDGGSLSRVADVVNKLSATGLFGTVATFDGAASTPTLAVLNTYDAVMVTANTPWASAANLGTVMRQYVDGGGGVVQTVFTSGGAASGSLAGTWNASYNCITFGPSTTGTATLGAIADQNHPIMIGVRSFNGGTSSFRPAGTALTAGATLVASWSDGKPLVAVGPLINRCDLGFFPASSDGGGAPFWLSSTDGVKLLANALLYVMRPRVLVIHSTGSAAVTADIVASIKGTNLFSVVDSFNGQTGTPTLTQLQAYDAALVANQAAWSNRTALGNVLADYVDAGRGVVQTVFTTAGIPDSNLGGRWTGTYDIIPFGPTTSGPATIDFIPFSDHPIVAGVATFDGGPNSSRPSGTTVNPGGFVVAEWSDGTILAAASTRLHNRVDLGFLPVSSAISASGWIATTDGDKLLANALLYTIKPYIGCVAGESAAPLDDVVAKLIASRRFSGVDSRNAAISTPTLGALRQYNAVLTWSGGSFYANSTALGVHMADYVDAGGGVVSAIFEITNIDPLGSRWSTDGYRITQSLPGSMTSVAQQFLGTVLEPAHPISSFVRSFAGGNRDFRQDSTPLLRGRTIMRWTDGKMLASVHNYMKRADLGYFPPSSAVTPNNWNQRTDGIWITANALEFVVRHKPCPGDFNGDGQIDDDDFVRFAAFYNELLDPRGDLNGDGLTDDNDFVIFAGGYDALVCP